MKIQRITTNPEHDGKNNRPLGVRIDFPAWPDTTTPNAPEAPAASYHFKPISDEPGAPWVADVDNPTHIGRLLGIPEAYRMYEDKKVPAAVAKANEGADFSAASTSQEPPLQPVSVAAASVSNERVAEIRALPVRELKAKINTYTPAELKAAYDAEMLEPAPRKNFCDVVQGQLGTDEG